MKTILFAIGILLLISSEILRVYFIMPFPGSQEDETIRTAYFLSQNIFYFRLIGLGMLIYPTYLFLKSGNQKTKVFVGLALIVYGLIYYAFNFRFLADKMFLQPKNKLFASVDTNKVPEDQLILGVTIQNENKAYPIEVIGYHHQVRDTLGKTPIMITYCTVCRTGRVYSPIVEGHEESFRLVGMDHYNAMFEDRTTRSWWRQVSGEAIVGPMAGKILDEIPSEQMTLASWINIHPTTLIMQPDSLFKESYDELSDYDEGKKTGRLESKDSLSWKDKSWVIGVTVNYKSRAYDWIELQQQRIFQDTLSATPLLISIEPDSASFHVFNRIVDLDTLNFSITNQGNNLEDSKTKSVWNWQGKCVEGDLKDKALKPIQAYQEYWHSWRLFRGKNIYHSK